MELLTSAELDYLLALLRRLTKHHPKLTIRRVAQSLFKLLTDERYD